MSQDGAKPTGYYGHVRTDLVGLLPSGGVGDLLEIGAAQGDTLVHIKQKGLAKRVVGVELCALPGGGQQRPEIDAFHVGNVESPECDFPPGSFDAVVAGDVLEHLVDPWAAVRKIETWLRPGGIAILCVPNFREASVLWDVLVRGDFAYQPDGILDRTHLRFFCKRNVLELATTDHLRPESIGPTYRMHWGSKHALRRVVHAISFGLLEPFLAVQYTVVARKVA